MILSVWNSQRVANLYGLGSIYIVKSRGFQAQATVGGF